MARIARDYILAVLSHGVFTDREVHGPNRQSAQQEQRAEERENRIGPNDVLHRTSRAHPSSGGLFFARFIASHEAGSRFLFSFTQFDPQPAAWLLLRAHLQPLAFQDCDTAEAGNQLATKARPSREPPLRLHADTHLTSVGIHHVDDVSTPCLRGCMATRRVELCVRGVVGELAKRHNEVSTAN